MDSKIERLYDMDRLKGLAIFLVVLGHLVATGATLEGADWFLQLKAYIYKFHMPLFMFTSGVIFFYTYERNKPVNIKSYWTYAAKKNHRLMPAYLIFAMVIIIGKILASNVMHVDNVEYDIFNSIVAVIVDPARSSAGSLWYIYVLLQLYLLAPVVLKYVNGKYYVLLMVSFVLHYIPVTSYFMLDRLFEYSLYFSLGIVAVNNYDLYKSMVNRYKYVFIVLFLSSFLMIDYVSDVNSKLIIGLFSIPAIHAIVLVTFLNNSKFLLVLAKYTFSIYLMNTIAIGLAKGILFKFVYWDNNYFVIFLVILLMSGLFVPILVKKYIFKHFNYIDKMTS